MATGAKFLRNSVHLRPAFVHPGKPRRSPAKPLAQLSEGHRDALVAQRRAAIREEEGIGLGCGVHAISHCGVAVQGIGRRWMQRHQPALAGLALHNIEHAGCEIDVLAFKRQSLADSEAC